MKNSFAFFIYTVYFPFLLQAYNPQNEKIIICGVGKNIEHTLPNMIQKIECLGAHFKDYRVIIYENNSTDNTAALLHDWAMGNTKVIVKSEFLDPDQLSQRTIAHALSNKTPCRMELIAYARNYTLKKALEEQFNDFNFILMTDMDFTRGWEIEGILSSFTLLLEWDCMAANGIDFHFTTYYDRFAHRDETMPIGPEVLGEEWWKSLKESPQPFQRGEVPQKVYSAFGGVALYKRESLKNCQYSGYVTPDLEKLLFTIINTLPTDHPYYQLYKKILNKDIHPLPVVFVPNCGYDGPVTCEHIALHASMIMNGCDKIYVNPAMICYY